MEKERISVIIPAHNVEAYLERCMDSVLGQTYNELEIILVENGSTDRTPELCDTYARRDSRVRVVHLEIGDVSTARNVGVRLSTAPYICFVDSDDYLDIRLCEVLMDKLTRCTDADMAYCSYFSTYEDGRKKEQQIVRHKDLYTYSGCEQVRMLLLDKTFCTLWPGIFRKTIFEGVQFPEGFFYEDYITLLFLSEKCRKVVYTPEPLYYYWQRSDSITHTYSIRHMYQHFLIGFMAWEFAKQRQMLNRDDYRQFVNRIITQNHFFYKKVVDTSSSQHPCKAEIADMKRKTQEMLHEEWCKLSPRSMFELFKHTTAGCLLRRYYHRLRNRQF
ncbi:glycosyltransferase family 2 protein [Bacteroides sp. AN502(2024)]|uniref:glycosyltransferase family 2 protein n=1 Tax=Bacteroides sp. AN502(2024) TaxID=3160599 RepID=UPI0035161848